jgi:hypothetical protein
MTQIYDTVIKLSLAESGVLSGISAIVAQLSRGTGETKKFESALKNLKVAAWSAAGIFAGWEAIKGIKHLADHAKDLSHELVQIKKLNADMSAKDFARVQEWAFGMPGRVPGTTSVEALKTMAQFNPCLARTKLSQWGTRSRVLDRSSATRKGIGAIRRIKFLK